MKIKCSIILCLALLAGSPLHAQDHGRPVIDMHLHAYDSNSYFQAPDSSGRMAPENAAKHFSMTYEIMRRNNIVLGVPSGTSRAAEEYWINQDSDARFLRGVGFSPSRIEWTPERFEAEVQKGNVKVFGELGPYYAGKSIADDAYAPYLAICEKYDIPVAVHMGSGPPGTPYRGAPNARIKYGNPLTLEDVLIRHPKLRLYIMHAGVAYHDEALDVMLVHPQVYADLGVILWVHENPKYYGEQFLMKAKKFGMLDRVMFGSDQMVWPHAIEASIKQLNSFEFLNEEDKRDILYNNAARFLGLSEDVIATHHGQ